MSNSINTLTDSSSPYGCVGAIPIAHLYQDIMELLVEPHTHLLGAQILASTLYPEHCSHQVVTWPQILCGHLTKYKEAPFLSHGSYV